MTTPHSAAPERSVVDRTLSILGAFDRDNRTLTLSDISRRACLPVATVHRIVTKLHGWGALERSPEGGYSIGLRLWETAILAPRSAVVEAAQPHLVALHAQTQAAAMIAIRDGKECVGLSFVSDDPILTALCGNPGTRIPLHATATGLVLLAHAGSAVQNEVCSGPLRAYTPATLTNRSHLKQCLAKVRREGYAAARGTFAPDCACFAVPVRDSRGVVVAAVGVVGSSDTFQPRRVAPHVRAAAALIQRHVRSEGLRVTEVGA